MKINKKNKSNYVIARNLLSCAIFVMLIITVCFYVSFSYYTQNKTGIFYEATAFTSDSDVDIKVYLQALDDSGNTYYTRVFFTPDYGYTYNESKTECSDGISLTRTVDGFDVTASKRGRCKVYFDREDGITSDIITNIYASDDGVTYTPVLKVPDNGYLYEISTTNTSCTNDATATINNNKIEVTSTGPTVCNVYITKTSTSVS